MDITLKLSKDFERCLEDLKKKYGEDFEYINGLHPSQLDFSEFLDKFVAEDTMADATIDPNANARHKDIRSFMTEKGKSEDKLFGLNKIFTEIKKRWGLRTAKQWLEQEFSKGFYLNDSATASYFPYCWANSPAPCSPLDYPGLSPRPSYPAKAHTRRPFSNWRIRPAPRPYQAN